MVDFSEYLNFLEELEHTLQQLVDVEQKKSAAVSARDLDALNDCMKREQAFSMTLKALSKSARGSSPHWGWRMSPSGRFPAAVLQSTGSRQTHVRAAYQPIPHPEQRPGALPHFDGEPAPADRRGAAAQRLEEEGPSTASRTGSDTHTDLRV